jgi:hypothetical protein
MPKFKSEAITIHLGMKLKKFLEKVSKEHEMSQAEFVRYLLHKYSENYDNKKNI